jgi:hypothetical protein
MELNANIIDLIIYVFAMVYVKKWSVHRHVCMFFAQPTNSSVLI